MLTGVDRESGQRIEIPMSARDVEQVMITAQRLPDPEFDEDDGEDDDG
jgi:hypothetical protein